MESDIIRRLLEHLVADTPGPIIHRTLQADGYTETEILDAWNHARAGGYTESSGLGRDRLTDSGRDRARGDRA